jgi:F0F1-type ATP synthase assembly protein I
MARKFKGLENQQYYRGAMRWMSIGIEFAIVCGIGAAVGYWLDTLEDSSPGLMIIGFFAGFGIMFYIMLKRAKGSNEEIEQDYSERNSEDNRQDR